jgi:hypothetical protein
MNWRKIKLIILEIAKAHGQILVAIVCFFFLYNVCWKHF